MTLSVWLFWGQYIWFGDYVLVDLGTMYWLFWGQYHIDFSEKIMFWLIWGQYKLVFFWQMSIFWFIFRHSDVYIFWKYVYFEWFDNNVRLICQYSDTLYGYFLKMLIFFDHLMRFWCGIFSKFTHFGCCDSVLMWIFSENMYVLDHLTKLLRS